MFEQGDEIGASCASCVFPLWFAKQKTETGEIDAGYCRRNPPVPLLKTIVEQSKIAGAPPNVTYSVEPAFPLTVATGWCGEHLTLDEYVGLRSGGGNVLEPIDVEGSEDRSYSEQST